MDFKDLLEDFLEVVDDKELFSLIGSQKQEGPFVDFLVFEFAPDLLEFNFVHLGLIGATTHQQGTEVTWQLDDFNNELFDCFHWNLVLVPEDGTDLALNRTASTL